MKDLLYFIVKERFVAVNLQKVKKANKLQNYCEIKGIYFGGGRKIENLFIKERCILFSKNENKREKSFNVN